MCLERNTAQPGRENFLYSCPQYKKNLINDKSLTKAPARNGLHYTVMLAKLYRLVNLPKSMANILKI